MLYLKHTDAPQSVYIPRPGGAALHALASLYLKSTVDLTEVSITVEKTEETAQYYKVIACIPDSLPPGEYEYKLHDNTGVYVTGVAMIGEVTQETNQYQESLSYEQYKTD